MTIHDDRQREQEHLLDESNDPLIRALRAIPKPDRSRRRRSRPMRRRTTPPQLMSLPPGDEATSRQADPNTMKLF